MASQGWFDKLAKRAEKTSGRPITFIIAAFVVLAWLVSGPFFRFSDTWQLVINTATTIITFLMVFLIQSTQNRDTTAIQVKLDELIRATKGAHNALLDLEELGEEELRKIRGRYEHLAAIARAALGRQEIDTDSPDLEESSDEVSGASD